MIVERAAGVPLFAEELARMLDERRGRHRAARDPAGHRRRADRRSRPEERRRSCRTQPCSARCSGRTRSARSRVSSDDELDEGLRSLERREFVRRERRSAVEGARQYVFLHALVRDAAYGQIPRAARSAKHRATADWIMRLPADRAEDRAETLAHHLESAISYGEAAGLDVERPETARACRRSAMRAIERRRSTSTRAPPATTGGRSSSCPTGSPTPSCDSATGGR